MKKLTIFVLILLSLVFALPLNAAAQTQTPEPTPESQGGQTVVTQIGENEATVTFETLGYGDEILNGPFDSTRFRFTPPPHWSLLPGSQVVINYDVFASGVSAASASPLDATNLPTNQFFGVLAVSFNGQIVENINLIALGSASATVQLPAEVLVSARADGRQELEIFLNAERDCDQNVHTSVIIKPNSNFYLPFEVSPPSLDLSSLPYPFYLRDALLPEQSIVVVPSDPESDELQAALNVAAGFGSTAGPSFVFELVSADQLSQDMLVANNVIFVGMPEGLPELGEVPFSLAVSQGGFDGLDPANADDGIIQIAPSPWNESKAVLLVSGATPAGVNKAAQTISTGSIFINQDPTLAYVADVQSQIASVPVVENFTLKDLGYQTKSVTDVGITDLDYTFMVSQDQVAAKDAYIDLDYFHSGLFDYGASSMAVRLNGQVIASQPLREESVDPTTLHIMIPQGILRFGENQLTVTTGLLPISSCTATGQARYFFTVLDTTTFYIPAEPEVRGFVTVAADLSQFPQLFLEQSDLGDTAFVLPRQDPNSWNIAAQIAFELGQAINPVIANLSASYGEAVPEETIQGKSLVAVGKASTLPFLSNINEVLPAPFDLSTDTASEQNMQVVYRIPENISVGYLQILPSPFNNDRAILIVSGNSEEGVAMAGRALLTPETSNQLSGMFAITNGLQVATGSQASAFASGEGNPSVVATLAPGAEKVIATPFPDVSMVAQNYQIPAWLAPFIIISIAVIVLVLVSRLIVGLRRRRPASVSFPQNQD